MENVTFEIAKKLKEFGYTELFCEKYYYSKDECIYNSPILLSYYKNEPDKIILAPTWFKAINWLRETYGVHLYSEWSNDDKFTLVLQGDIFKGVVENDIFHNTIEEAYESGFKEAFEIIEKKKKEDQEYIMGMINKYKPEIDKIFEDKKDLFSRKEMIAQIEKSLKYYENEGRYDYSAGFHKAMYLIRNFGLEDKSIGNVTLK